MKRAWCSENGGLTAINGGRGCVASAVKSGSLLNHFFTQTVWAKLLSAGSHRLYDAILKKYATGRFDYRHHTNGEILVWLYDFLSKNWRNEFFFRNELMRHYLIEEKPSSDVVALTQLPIASSRADFVLVNGEGVVYEIKTDHDSTDRLNGQLANYYKAFSKVYVVVGDILLDETLEHLRGTKTGVLHLTRDNKFIVKKRAVADTSHLDHAVIFKMLHKSEIEAILMDYYHCLPEARQHEYYRVAQQMFIQIPMRKVERLVRRELKKRMSCARERVAFPETMAMSYFWAKDTPPRPVVLRFMNRRYRKATSEHDRKEHDDESKILPLL